MNEDRLKEYCEKALHQEMVLTRFLDETEQSFLRKMVKPPLQIYFDGGYQDAEKCRAIISINGNDSNHFAIVIYELKFPIKFIKPNHRNVLGNLMALGIVRDVIGDIVITSDEVPRIFIVCDQSIAPYLLDNFTMLNHYPIELIEIQDSKVLSDNYSPILERILVASMRLDVIIANCLHLSRKDTSDVIRSGRVFLNHIEILNDAKEIHENDLISIRHFGRIKIIERLGLTKKTKIILLVEIKH